MTEPSSVNENSEEELVSKSQLKREYKAFQDLGKELVELPKKQLEIIPVSNEMRELIVMAQLLERGALNRQLRLIGSRMPGEDIEGIRLALYKLQQPNKQVIGELHELEQWRDRLLQGDHAIYEELTTEFDNFDRQYVNQMTRNAKKEADNNKPPKSSRLLFKYLSTLKN